MSEAVPSGAQRATDEELCTRVRDGDLDAFELLYERYIRRVYAFVHKRLRNRLDSEETVQEVFINVFSSIDSFRGEAPFAAWVLGVTRRTIASRFKRKHPPTVPLEGEEVCDTVDLMVPLLSREASPHEAYEYQERVERLSQAADEDLSAAQRELFELHHLKHKSISEIASTLRKSEDAVKSNLYRARKLLLAR